MTAHDWNRCQDIGAMLDALRGRTSKGVLEQFCAEERFRFPKFGAILIWTCLEQGLELKGSEWVKQEWPALEDHVRACGVLRRMFKGVFVEAG